MVRSANFESLKRWVGSIPDHGKPLGVCQVRSSACMLMSHRSATDIESMLTILRARVEADDMNNFDFQLPPPGFNWELHGTALWRCICSISHAQKAMVGDPENWEFVGAIALYFLKKTVISLARDPIGLGIFPRTAGLIPQQLIAKASQLLLFASKEKEAKSISTGRKIMTASVKGNTSRYKSDQKSTRYNAMREEAASIRLKNPKLSTTAIAKKISDNHPGVIGYGWRTVYKAITEEKT